MRFARRGSVLAATSVAIVSASAVRAEPDSPRDRETVVVQVSGPQSSSDCPGARELSSALEREGVGAGDKDVVHLDVAFSRSGSGYTVTVSASGGTTGTRTLHGDDPSCAALTNALVAASALLVDDASSAAPELPPTPNALAAKATSATPSALAEGPRAPATPPSWARFDLDAGAGVAAGVLASAAPLGTAGVAWNPTPRLSIGVELWGVPAQTLAYSPGTISMWLAAGSPFVCGTLLGGAAGLRVSACAKPVVGVVHAWGGGYLTDQAETKPWVSLAAGLRAAGHVVGPLQWSARIEPLVLLDPEGFEVDNLGVGYTPQRIGLVATLGARASIW
jgi:hypothetical protein